MRTIPNLKGTIMLKDKKKFAIKATLATAALVALGIEVDCTIQQLRTLKRDSDRYQIGYNAQRNLIKQMLVDLEGVEDIETLKHTTAYWKSVMNTA